MKKFLFVLILLILVIAIKKSKAQTNETKYNDTEVYIGKRTIEIITTDKEAIKNLNGLEALEKDTSTRAIHYWFSKDLNVEILNKKLKDINYNITFEYIIEN